MGRSRRRRIYAFLWLVNGWSFLSLLQILRHYDEGVEEGEKALFILLLDFIEHVVDVVEGVFFGEFLGEAVGDEERGVLFELEDFEDAVEGEFGFGEGFGPAGVKYFLSAVGVSFEGGLSIFDDGLVDLLPLLFLPFLHRDETYLIYNDQI